MKRPARVPSQLSETLHHRLNAYALVASAAGVGVLALTVPADAKIIYTPAHIEILPGRPAHHYSLEINHDGVVDFVLSNRNGLYRSCNCLDYWVRVRPGQQGNEIWGVDTLASALPSGVQIGSNSKFGVFAEMWGWATSNGQSVSRGQWKNVKNRYLGLKFVVKGTAIHYGWARLNVTIAGKPPKATVLLTGYAYETIPNKPIITGQTHGGNEATLGRLAQGASGLSNGEKP
jgi:hypothetical protein